LYLVQIIPIWKNDFSQSAGVNLMSLI